MAVNPNHQPISLQQYIDNLVELQKARESGTVYKIELKDGKIQSESLLGRIFRTITHNLKILGDFLFKTNVATNINNEKEIKLVSEIKKISITNKNEKVLISIENYFRFQKIILDKKHKEEILDNYEKLNFKYTTGSPQIDSFMGLEGKINQDQLTIAQKLDLSSFQDLNLDGLHKEFEKLSGAVNITQDFKLQPTPSQLRTALVLIKDLLDINKVWNSNTVQFLARVMQYIMCGSANIKNIVFPEKDFSFQSFANIMPLEKSNQKSTLDNINEIPRCDNPFKATSLGDFRKSLTESIAILKSFEELNRLRQEFRNSKVGNATISDNTINSNFAQLKKAFNLIRGSIHPLSTDAFSAENKRVLAHMTQYIMLYPMKISSIPFPKDEFCFKASDLELPIKFNIDYEDSDLNFLIDLKRDLTENEVKMNRNNEVILYIGKLHQIFNKTNGNVDIVNKELIPSKKQLKSAFKLTIDYLLPQFTEPLTPDDRRILARMTQYIMCGPKKIKNVSFPKDEFCFTCKELKDLRDPIPVVGYDSPFHWHMQNSEKFKKTQQLKDAMKKYVQQFFLDTGGRSIPVIFNHVTYTCKTKQKISDLFSAIKQDFLDQLKNPSQRNLWIMHNKKLATFAGISDTLNQDEFGKILDTAPTDTKKYLDCIKKNSSFSAEEVTDLTSTSKLSLDFLNGQLRSRLIQVMVLLNQSVFGTGPEHLGKQAEGRIELRLNKKLDTVCQSIPLEVYYELDSNQQKNYARYQYSMSVEDANQLDLHTTFQTKVGSKEYTSFASIEKAFEIPEIAGPSENKATLTNYENIHVGIQSLPILDNFIDAFKEPSKS